MSSPQPILPTAPTSQAIDLKQVTIAPFNTDPLTIQPDNIFDEFHRLGVTHLTFGCFINPADSHLTSLADVQTQWNLLVRPRFDACAAAGFRAVITADDMLRTPGERQWVWSCPWAADAVKYAVGQAAATGIVDRAEMVDEIGSDPREYKPDDLVAWWRSVPNAPPIAWPNRYPIAWETDDLSDYTSRYWEVWTPGDAHYQADGVAAAARNVRAGRPWLCSASCVGPMYTKRVPGGDYSPGDSAYSLGVTHGREIIGQFWNALAYGASGLRIYGYDWLLWRNQRAGAPLGTRMLQTGSRSGDARWAGFAAACLSVSGRRAAILADPYVPVVNGPWVCGRRGGLWWASNRSLEPQVANRPGTVVTARGEMQGALVPSGTTILWPV